ncbi:putative MFS-type transporter EfpA [Baekduia alba]|uniref:MFS transporter n=1 Tax=Baekduia alba TaxID=2997333 RepID=UPI002341E56A|nr:MFS transporter [Baekduia alba]WCB96443.1 putative MFS-type transporter EfpA [Baekduia alba]
MTPTEHHDAHHSRRWLILAVLGLAQLMVVLDATIVNIALPSAQKDLGFSDESRQWIVTAYALAFGSLLLLGGRIGDLFGRKWVFIAGLAGFAVASAAGGAAQSFGMLVAARAAQGVFGAMLAPAALSLLTTTFTDPAERNKAFGIFGAIAGSGAAAGLLLGGVLTEYLSWRWCLYVNLAFAGVAVFGAFTLLTNIAQANKPRLDIPGTVTASAGLFSLVYGFSHASQTSWTNPTTLGFLVAGVVLLAAFVLIQQRVAHPLLPLRVVLDRDRGGAYLAMGLSAISMFGVFLFLTYYLQQNLGFSPIKTGLAFLPMTFAIMFSATTSQTQLMPRTGARPLIGTGLALGAIGMLYLTGIGVDSSYASHVLPGLLVMGLGLGLVFAPAMSSATLGVDPSDAGVASATVNTMQQIGGSIGTALLSTLAASATTAALDTGGAPTKAVVAQAAVHGYTTAFYWSAAIFAVAAVLCTALLRSGARAPSTVGEPVFAH